MRRLIDETGTGDDALLGRLFRSVGPLPESEVSRRRVGREVSQRVARRVARGSSLPRLRTVMAASALVLIGGIAGATVGRDAWERLFAPAVAPLPTPTPSPTTRDDRATPGAAAVGGTTVTAPPVNLDSPAPSSPAVAPSPAPVANTARGAAPEGTRPARHAASVGERAAVVPALTAEEMDNINAVMTRALRELRKNPAFARVAAEDYLRKAPAGMLVEDAAYVACEAAFAEHDADAGQLATRYLSRYPSGNYAPRVHALVERAATAPTVEP